LDFRLAIQAMIERDLQGTTVNRPDSLAGQTVLDLRGVQLTRNAKPFDFSLRAGEIVAIAGALGSGKSRLLGALFGLSRIAAGEIRLHGTRWQPKGPGEAIRNGVFMAGEDRWHSSLLPPATLGGNIAGTIALPHRPHWFPFGFVRRAKEQAAAAKAITALGIRCVSSDDTMDLLSGGNQQKVVVGRWQAEPCHLLLLDEPFQGIDVGARQTLGSDSASGSHCCFPGDRFLVLDGTDPLGASLICGRRKRDGGLFGGRIGQTLPGSGLCYLRHLIRLGRSICHGPGRPR
jgi:simple sugar transport system ATP-binding protein